MVRRSEGWDVGRLGSWEAGKPGRQEGEKIRRSEVEIKTGISSFSLYPLAFIL
jgi:hypothetical protein